MNKLTRFLILVTTTIFLTSIIGCSKSDPSSNASSTTSTGKSAPLKLLLDWKPEPEFGGFYAAEQTDGGFAKNGLTVAIESAGEGAPTWQLIAQGRADFGITAADQILIARAHGADVVAFFAVYQTSPQGIMVHKARGFTSIKDIFTHDGTLLAEPNSWLDYLRKKIGTPKVKIITYDNEIAQFLAKPDLSQQCFITSEPIQATRQNGDPQTFLIADEGFNPYTTVVFCKADLWRTNPQRVKAMALACRAGWRNYLDDPMPTNMVMQTLNKDMDAQTFALAAAAQKPLIETEETRTAGLGSMTAARWNTLTGQLTDLGVLDKPVRGEDCFVNP